MRRIPQFDAGARRFEPDLVEAFLAARRAQNHVVRIVALIAIAMTCSIVYWISGSAVLSKGLASFTGGI